MTGLLQSLIKSAKEDARPQFACADGDHHWQSEGGRSCPMGAEGCSQAVYRCAICGIHDYGDGDGPGATDCRAACGDSMMGWRNGPFDPQPDP
jgi:hypothetical protein